jgi:flagellar basal-body rod protein FlgC
VAADPLSAGSQGGTGVRYQVEIDSQAEPRRVHEPGHPDADQDGYVSFPNINMITEFVNALEASRAYEANVTAIDLTKQMANLALRILA